MYFGVIEGLFIVIDNEISRFLCSKLSNILL